MCQEGLTEINYLYGWKIPFTGEMTPIKVTDVVEGTLQSEKVKSEAKEFVDEDRAHDQLEDMSEDVIIPVKHQPPIGGKSSGKKGAIFRVKAGYKSKYF